jgi:hypothetical protein
MPKEAHIKAAEHHETAAKSHRTAVEHHGKGEGAKKPARRKAIRRLRASSQKWRTGKAIRQNSNVRRTGAAFAAAPNHFG